MGWGDGVHDQRRGAGLMPSADFLICTDKADVHSDGEVTMKAEVTAHKDFTVSTNRRPDLFGVSGASGPRDLHRDL